MKKFDCKYWLRANSTEICLDRRGAAQEEGNICT